MNGQFWKTRKPNKMKTLMFSCLNHKKDTRNKNAKQERGKKMKQKERKNNEKQEITKITNFIVLQEDTELNEYDQNIADTENLEDYEF